MDLRQFLGMLRARWRFMALTLLLGTLGVAKLLGLEKSVGLVTVLLGRAALQQAVQPYRSELTFLGTGPLPPNPAEVLDTQVMRNLLSETRQAFDVVIVEAPPLLPIADAAILLTEVDGGLLLVRHGTTHREQLRRAVARAQAVGGRIFGTDVNRAPLGGKASSYGYYSYEYGYGNGYGGSNGTERAGATRVRPRPVMTPCAP